MYYHIYNTEYKKKKLININFYKTCLKITMLIFKYVDVASDMTGKFQHISSDFKDTVSNVFSRISLSSISVPSIMSLPSVDTIDGAVTQVQSTQISKTVTMPQESGTKIKTITISQIEETE